MNELDKQNFTNYVEVKSFGDIFPKKGTNTRTPYEHQKKAMEALDKMNQEASYSTLVVLPMFIIAISFFISSRTTI